MKVRVHRAWVNMLRVNMLRTWVNVLRVYMLRTWVVMMLGISWSGKQTANQKRQS
jgi:hypothetical protein